MNSSFQLLRNVKLRLTHQEVTEATEGCVHADSSGMHSVPMGLALIPLCFLWFKNRVSEKGRWNHKVHGGHKGF